MKFAARRMQRELDYAWIAKNVIAREHILMTIVSWPFRMIGRAFRWFFDCVTAILSWFWDLLVWAMRGIWAWICGINLIGLINLALLVAIIVLCSMLILDILNCRRKPIVINGPAKNVQIEFTKTKKSIPIPNRRNETKGELPVATVVPTKPSADPTLQANTEGELYGDIIIESRGEAVMIKNGMHIHGNLYLQRMNKYVLPCNVTIDGNLFLRDLRILQFCGAFNVKGNIYVSPRSSFGPIPHNAKVGGQVIL